MGTCTRGGARRFRDIIRGYEAEFETANDFDGSLAAFLVLKAENLQARHLLGENVDSDEVVRLSGQLRQVLTALRRGSTMDAPAAPSLADQLVEANHDNDEHGGEARTLMFGRSDDLGPSLHLAGITARMD